MSMCKPEGVGVRWGLGKGEFYNLCFPYYSHQCSGGARNVSVGG